MKISRLTITQTRKLLRNGDISPVDVVEDLINTVETRDPEIGAYLDFYAEEMLAEARTRSKTLDYRELPLGGIPIAVKDNICVRDRKTTCGSRMLAGYKSLFTATAVEKLINAGAFIAGKTNCDEFAMGSSNENSAFGPVRNPWDPSRVPGGSSGGSAAVVAAGMAPGALGSDTGGSIRQPASFCGIVGLKPTYGRISRKGLVAFASSFDQIGPMARSVEDTALLLEILSGNDTGDSTSLSASVPDMMAGLKRGFDGLTIGIPRGFVGENIHEDVRSDFERLTRLVAGSGVPVRDIEIPHLDYGIAAYYVIANAEASANLARYDGIAYGHRSEHSGDLESLYRNTRAEGFGEEVKRRILLGTFVLSSGYYDEYYIKAQKVRSLIMADVRSAFEQCDLIMLPTSPDPAFKLGEKTGDPVSMYMSDIYTVPANLAGVPAISVPAGLSRNGLPVGVQLIGPVLGEEKLLRGAYGIEKLTGFEESAID